MGKDKKEGWRKQWVGSNRKPLSGDYISVGLLITELTSSY
jgi:hypothetical protein